METSYQKTDAGPHEHRYQPDPNIEQIDSKLVKRIVLPESGNALLCAKLGLPGREPATLDQQEVSTFFGADSDVCAEEPYPQFY